MPKVLHVLKLSTFMIFLLVYSIDSSHLKQLCHPYKYYAVHIRPKFFMIYKVKGIFDYDLKINQYGLYLNIFYRQIEDKDCTPSSCPTPNSHFVFQKYITSITHGKSSEVQYLNHRCENLQFFYKTIYNSMFSHLDEKSTLMRAQDVVISSTVQTIL